MSIQLSVVISPATITSPVVTSASHATRQLGSTREQGVEHRVGELVGELVGMPLGDGLRGEEVALAHVAREYSGRHGRGPRRRGQRDEPVADGPGELAPWSTCASGSSRPSARRIIASFVSDPNPVPSRPTSFTTTMVQVLRAGACRDRRPPGRRSPRRTRPGSATPLRSPSSRRMSGVGSRRSSGVPDSFFSLPSATAFGRKSATAAAITTTSASPAAEQRRRAASPRRSRRARCRRPGGGGTVSGPRIRRTSAPRDDASAATATPILPVERFPMNRTGSIGSCVGPAVTSIRTPSRSCRRATARFDGSEDVLGLGEAAETLVAGGQRPDDRTDEHGTALRERRDVRGASRDAATCRCASRGRGSAGWSPRAGSTRAGRRRSPWRASR